MWEQEGVRWFHLLGSLKNLTIGLIWLVTRGGGVEGVGQGGGQGRGRWGAPESKNKNWSDLAGDEGRRGGGGGRARGGRLGGGTREQCGSNKAFTGLLKT